MCDVARSVEKADRRSWDLLRVAPGVVAAGVGAGTAAVVAGELWPGARTLVALAVGFGIARVRLWPASVIGGLRFSGRTLLRVGVALLGFRVATDDLLALGASGAGVIVLVVLVGLVTGRVFGLLLGVPDRLSTLLAAGSAICGASAVAAVGTAVDADDEEVAACIGLVTLCGTVAMLLFPWVASTAGWDQSFTGRWLGLSIHDVGQVAAAASTVGPVALDEAVITKLARVTMLAPVVLLLGAARRRSVHPPGDDGEHSTAARREVRPPLVPWFVVMFALGVILNSTGAVAPEMADRFAEVGTLTLLVAFVGIGSELNSRSLRGLGWRPVAALAATAGLLAVVSAVATVAVGPS